MDVGEAHPLSVEASSSLKSQSSCDQRRSVYLKFQPGGAETNATSSDSEYLRINAPEARESSRKRGSSPSKVDIKVDQGNDDAAAAKTVAAGASTSKTVPGSRALSKSSNMDMPQPINRDSSSQWEDVFQSRLESYTQAIETLILKQQRELLKAVREEIFQGLWSSRRKFKETLQKKERKAAAQFESSERMAMASDAALEKAVEKSIRSSSRNRISYMTKLLPAETSQDPPSPRGNQEIFEKQEGSGSEAFSNFESSQGRALTASMTEHWSTQQLAGIEQTVARTSKVPDSLARNFQAFQVQFPKEMPQNCLTKITNSKLFGAFSAGLILLNAIFIGIETDTSVRCSMEGDDLPKIYSVINKMFTSCFVVELVMRFVAERSWFIVGESWRWNLFDTVLVLSGLVQMLLEGVTSMSFARVLRAFRMVRATRVIKVLRFFHELRRMVSSIVSSLASLGWALLLLGLIKYLVAICFTQAAAGYLRDHIDKPETEEIIGIKQWYSSLGMCMLSLMLSISGGADWYDVASPLEGVSKLYMFLFVFYVFFVIFGVLNVLVGVFLASAAEVMDRDVIVQSEIMKTNAAVKELHMLFMEIDKNGTGQISLQELGEYLQDEKAQAYFAWNCLDPTDPYMLFKLMDKDSDGQVDMREFIFSMMKCKGSAKGTDMRALLQEVKRTQDKLEMMTSALMEYPLVGCQDPAGDDDQRVTSNEPSFASDAHETRYQATGTSSVRTTTLRVPIEKSGNGVW